MTPAREAFLALLENTNEKFGHMVLYDPQDRCFCAIGLYAHKVLGVDLQEMERFYTQPIYDAVTEALDLGKFGAHIIFDINDRVDSFKSVAEVLRTKWSES